MWDRTTLSALSVDDMKPPVLLLGQLAESSISKYQNLADSATLHRLLMVHRTASLVDSATESWQHPLTPDDYLRHGGGAGTAGAGAAAGGNDEDEYDDYTIAEDSNNGNVNSNVNSNVNGNVNSNANSNVNSNGYSNGYSNGTAMSTAMGTVTVVLDVRARCDLDLVTHGKEFVSTARIMPRGRKSFEKTAMEEIGRRGKKNGMGVQMPHIS